MMIYVVFYRLVLGCYALAIRIAALFNHKAKLFVAGRKNGLPAMRNRLAGDSRKRIWMHCASLGEFEQGRPVIEAIRERYPEYAVVLTFFSPSGYEVRKDYQGADYVFYLPMDTDRNAKTFLDIVNPTLCIFIKYEFWYFYLTNIAVRNIQAILVSAVFTKDQVFFKWYGGLPRYMLGCFSHIFVQDAISEALLKKIAIKNVSLSGDTRFDRVIKIAQQADGLPVADSFSLGHKVLVAGSTWPDDERFLQKAMALLPIDYKLILVPHEVNEARLSEIEQFFKGSTVRWGQWNGETDKRVLVVDRVGLLAQLYRYGFAAWIGGGFGREGVHNVPEAAVYGIPCFFGPVFHRYLEAEELIARGGAVTLREPEAFAAAIKELEDAGRYGQFGRVAKGYVYSGAGATARVIEYIKAWGGLAGQS